MEQPVEYQSEPEAVYQLESPVHCPHCAISLDTVQVIRLLRTKVNFTSALPRRGYVVACPECKKVIPAAVG